MELRKGYKQTEVGVVPKDWNVTRLGEIAVIQRGASPRPIDSPIWFNENSDVGWVRISDVTRSGIYLNETTQKLSEAGIRNSRPVAPNSLIMSICATVGRPIITLFPTCIHDGFVVFDKTTTNQLLLYYILQSIEPDWSKHGQTGSQMNLNTGLIRGTQVPLPPTKVEQEAIAEALSDADALIASLEQLIAKKRCIKQGAMQELLTGKRRLPGFSGDWVEKTLGDVSTFFKGRGLPKSSLTPSGADRCIHYGELFTQYGHTIEEVISRTDATADSFLSSANDVLMPTSDVTPSGLAKASCILEDGIVLGGDILVIRTEMGLVNGTFLSCLIRLEEQQVLQLVTGSTVYHLYASDMKNFMLRLPSYDEQTAIATILSDIDAETAALETKLAKARQVKQGMMQELLTGRIRLV